MHCLQLSHPQSSRSERAWHICILSVHCMRLTSQAQTDGAFTRPWRWKDTGRQDSNQDDSAPGPVLTTSTPADGENAGTIATSVAPPPTTMRRPPSAVPAAAIYSAFLPDHSYPPGLRGGSDDAPNKDRNATKAASNPLPVGLRLLMASVLAAADSVSPHHIQNS